MTAPSSVLIGRVDLLGFELSRRRCLDIRDFLNTHNSRDSLDVRNNLCVVGHLVDLIEIEGVKADEILGGSPDRLALDGDDLGVGTAAEGEGDDLPIGR